MATDYPGFVPPALPSVPSNIETANRSLKNVLSAFFALPNSGQFIKSKFSADQFPAYRLTKFARRRNKKRNHFQGIVRLRDGVHFVASVADKTEPAAVLALMKMESHTRVGLHSKGPVRSNLIFKETHNDDQLIELFHLNPGEDLYWHPGGLSIMGDVLAVPLEEFTNNTTRVDFYDFSNPVDPRKIPVSLNIDRRFGAVATCRVEGDKYLCAVWSDPHKGFRIYTSKTADLEDGFNERENFAAEINFDDIVNIENNHEDKKFQSTQFVRSEDGDLFIICSANYALASPVFHKNNYSVLLKIDYDPVDLDEFTLTFITKKVFLSEDDYSNFDAGVGIYLPNDEQMALYSIYHWRSEHRLKLSEYYGRSNRKPTKSNKTKDQFVEFYSEKNFLGRSLALYGEDLIAIQNYDDIVVQKSGFGDQAKSLRYRLPENKAYALYEHNNYNLDEYGNRMTLLGTGKVVEHSNLDNTTLPELLEKKAFGTKVSSSRWV